MIMKSNPLPIHETVKRDATVRKDGSKWQSGLLATVRKCESRGL